LTPPGRAALATIGIHGPRAWKTVRNLFQSRSGQNPPQEPAVGKFWLGRLGEEIADDIVLAVHSPGVVEIHCHGGPEVVRSFLELVQRHGICPGTWQGQNATGCLSLKAEAELSQATTVRTAGILLDQLHGALDQALATLEGFWKAGDQEQAQRLLDELIDRVPLGLHLTVPWKIVIAGAPNVGKSSLVNAIVGYQRSVVSTIPGTTLDVVTTRLAIDGWPVELADTAGIRGLAASLEGEGIALSRRQMQNADLCLWVLDKSQAPIYPEESAKQVTLVINKTDLPPVWNPQPGAIQVSARTGEGIADLCGAISKALVPDPPPAGAAVPFTSALADFLQECRGATVQNRQAFSLRAACR
jgi:tRNA modification GTPase